jgi:phosphoribosylaminoimidazole carboxylase (NCAIR synthetase)
MAAAAVTLFLSCWEFRPRIDRTMHAAIGKALAREAISLSQPVSQITLITRDTEEFPQPALDVLLASFKREVRRAQIKIAAMQLVQADPLRPLDVPPGDFFELLRRSPAEHIIVSLLGPPLLTGEQRSRLGRVRRR